MDMFFILLVFYFLVERGAVPIKRDVGLPMSAGTGKAHTLIQIIDAESYILLDSSSINAYKQFEGYRNRNSFFDRVTVGWDSLSSYIDHLKISLDSSTVLNHLILLRCPHTQDYAKVKKVIDRIIGKENKDGKKNIKLLLSVMGGSKDDLGLKTGKDRTGGREREFLEITFGSS
jgi:hypothetical protein